MQIPIKEIVRVIEPIACNTNLSSIFSGICLDSRKVRQGDIFVAIRSGHQFIEQAVEQGASALIVEQGNWYPSNSPAIVVANTVEALGRLAKLWRLQFSQCKVIAVTGSCGKTTTTQMTAHLLASQFNVHCTDQNHNNQIGVPETIFGIDEQTEFAVIEIGTNQKGEIKCLTKMIEPDIGVLTNIGPAHLEAFGNIGGVRTEKSALVFGVKPGGMVVINGDDENCMRILEQCDMSREIITFGLGNHCKVRVEPSNIAILDNWTGFEVVGSKGSAVLQVDYVMQRHNMMNALAAISIARHFKIDWDIIQDQLDNFQFPQMRFEKRIINGITIINDAYNANPYSMKAAILEAKSICSGRLILVLGDMLELGNASQRLHQDLGKFIESIGADVVIGIGREIYYTIKGLDRKSIDTHFFRFKEAGRSASILARITSSGDLVLFKASRSVKLDVLCDEFCTRLSEKS